MSANFKKQFQRVTQRLDQTFGSKEKSEVLSEDLQNLERRVEVIYRICQNISKKLLNCLSSQVQACDVDKRLKKIPRHGLSHSFIESAAQLGHDSGAGETFQVYGDAESTVAVETLQMEMEIENQVLRPLTELIEIDIPAIHKLRKQLGSRILDMDAARARCSSLSKQPVANSNVTGQQSKLDAARDEFDECVAKVEQTRDQLAGEMFVLLAREAELSRLAFNLANIEVIYHRRSLETLEKIIPHLQRTVEQSVVPTVFGVSLTEHTRSTGRHISAVLERCVTALCSVEYDALQEEGLFRVAGGTSKMKKLKSAFNCSSEPVELSRDEYSPHVVASVLKQYLRELPEPLMTFELYSDWMNAAQICGDQRLIAIRNVINKLPTVNKLNLEYLIKFLSKLAEFSETNKMSASNIAVVIGPNLLWPPGEASVNMMATSLVETLIVNAAYFFPKCIESGVNIDTSNSGAMKRHSSSVAEPARLNKSCSDSPRIDRPKAPPPPLPGKPTIPSERLSNAPPPLPEKPTLAEKPAANAEGRLVREKSAGNTRSNARTVHGDGDGVGAWSVAGSGHGVGSGSTWKAGHGGPVDIPPDDNPYRMTSGAGQFVGSGPEPAFSRSNLKATRYEINESTDSTRSAPRPQSMGSMGVAKPPKPQLPATRNKHSVSDTTADVSWKK